MTYVVFLIQAKPTIPNAELLKQLSTLGKKLANREAGYQDVEDDGTFKFYDKDAYNEWSNFANEVWANYENEYKKLFNEQQVNLIKPEWRFVLENTA
ncbi:MAG: hypothetical protein JRN26_07850 [Nitrososphaerota archaeon]|jgi:Fe-S cluster biosynthesis and repair protein YggX|nr:hypothetical protein [Nitrososphaerota archaeon]MDG6927271.1 hypothetical protein [Nitrososphaerota archaeon]MDG6930371.1 hypothetical protein [Nitrososphaerota archaeon]MDG6931727.1 hypothetical protein [Nitrososphaerota archaeon]MDG6936775.1 hypothetical protein [Nitrososphaerota archaeon]